MNADDSFTLSDDSSDNDSMGDLPKLIKSESKEIDNASLQGNNKMIPDIMNIERMNTYYQPTDIKKLIKRIKQAIKGNKTKEISLKKSLQFQDFDYLKSIIVKKKTKIDYEKLYKNVYELRENYEEEKERPVLGKKKKLIRLKIIRKPTTKKDKNNNTNANTVDNKNVNTNKENNINDNNSKEKNIKEKNEKKDGGNNVDIENEINDIIIINDEGTEDNNVEKNNDKNNKLENEKTKKNENKNLKTENQKNDEKTIDNYFKTKQNVDFRKSMGVKKKKENTEDKSKTNEENKDKKDEKTNVDDGNKAKSKVAFQEEEIKSKDKENNKNNVKNEKENNQTEKTMKKNFIRTKSEIYEPKKSKSINKKIDESKNDEGNISSQKKGKKGLGCKSTKNITTSFSEFKEDLIVKKSEKMLNRIAMFESKGNKEKEGIIYKGKMPSNKKVCFTQSNTESNNK